MGDTDAELLAGIAEGRMDALREVHDRHAPWLVARLSRCFSRWTDEPGRIASGALFAVGLGSWLLPSKWRPWLDPVDPEPDRSNHPLASHRTPAHLHNSIPPPGRPTPHRAVPACGTLRRPSNGILPLGRFCSAG